jgi:REP element-mobilizing transposase RayT
MPRPPRIEFPDAVYHVMARGNRREPIVLDDDDRLMLLKTLAELAGRTGFRIHAYALMDNHYHFVLETPKANLVAGMRWFQTTYTKRFNTRHGLDGHLFGGRYKSVIVQDQDGPYFRQLIDYVHLNPVRAGLVRRMGGFDDYEWTSLFDYRRPPSKRPAWMETADGFELAGLRDTPAGRRKYLERIEQMTNWTKPDEAGRVLWEGQTLQSTLRRGWYFGAQEFRDHLLKKLGKPEVEKQRRTRLLRERGSFQTDYDEGLAREIVNRGLEVVGLSEGELEGLRKNDWRKALIAHVLVERTSVRQDWIVEHLRMGTKPYVSRLASEMGGRVARDRKLGRMKARIAKVIV